MSQRKQGQSPEELLKKILIVQLAVAGVSQVKIQKIVQVDMNFISDIVKNIPKQHE